jgi:hypothetical protein
MPAAESLTLSSSARSHTCDHNAFASPSRISPVNCCSHVWYVHHHLVLFFCSTSAPRLNAAAKMGQTRGPSTRASRLYGRRARAQADETHAIPALADIIAKGNALVHFGAPAGYTNSSALKLLQRGTRILRIPCGMTEAGLLISAFLYDEVRQPVLCGVVVIFVYQIVPKTGIWYERFCTTKRSCIEFLSYCKGGIMMRLHKQVFPCRVPRALRSNGFTPFRFIDGPKKNRASACAGPPTMLP